MTGAQRRASQKNRESPTAWMRAELSRAAAATSGSGGSAARRAAAQRLAGL
jgi:hypothetical protein